MSTVRRSMVLRGALTGEVRTAQFEGRDYVVTPVVMLLGDHAIWALNSDAPELVPADVISQTPMGWAGRPVVMNHPVVDGVPVSANVPVVLEGWSFGQVFAPEFSENRLRAEAWLDPARAERIGDVAVRTLQRVRDKEPVEISVGCFVTFEDAEGVDAQGRKYKRRWASIVPDHLALLEEGATGACSVEMGCGTPRVMAAADGKCPDCKGAGLMPERGMGNPVGQAACPRCHGTGRASDGRRQLLTAQGFDVNWEGDMEGTGAAAAAAPARRSLKERFLALVRPLNAGKTEAELLALAGEDGVSANEIGYGLYMALYAVEPAFGGVDDWFPDTNKVIYCCYLPNEGRKVYRRSFTATPDGDVTVADDREEVQEVTTYEPVTTAAANAAADPAPATPPSAAAGGGCGCGGGGAREPQVAEPARGEVTMTDAEKAARAARVQALIDNTATPFAADDSAYLTALSDDRLAAFETKFAPAPAAATTAAAPAAAPAVPAPAAAAAEPTEEQWLGSAPKSVRDLVARAKAQEAAVRASLVSQLKDAQSAYTEAELNALPMEQLRKLAQVAAVPEPEPESVDFSALGGRAASGSDALRNPPNGYQIALDRQRAAARGTTAAQ